MRELLEQLEENKNVRQNLSRLRQEIKTDGNKNVFLEWLDGREGILSAFLSHEDAKTRKNAALLLGAVGKAEFLPLLYSAYQAETQMFVKSSYLTAMENYDCTQYESQLRERMTQLTGMAIEEENKKHGAEEIRQLSTLLLSVEGVKTHRFTGDDRAYDIILLTNRNFQEVTLAQLRERCPLAKAKVFGPGIMARVPDLNWAGDIRTYQELLFVVGGLKTCPMDAEQAGSVIGAPELIDFLENSHEGRAPFYFRVELKSKMEEGKRGAFAKRLAAEIERASGRKLVNTTSNYELELRLIENKEGSFNVLVKLFTKRDERFSYRSHFLPSGIRPYYAALAVELARKYLKEGARVLDPFCGTGTMLIERYKAVKADTSYGVDIQAEAIEKARDNTRRAGQLIHYINRDFFDFTHEYLFDEIITDMPFQIGRVREGEIEAVYRRFFQKVSGLLKEDGVILLYSHDKKMVRQYSGNHGFRIVEEWEISMREGTYVFVLKSV